MSKVVKIVATVTALLVLFAATLLVYLFNKYSVNLPDYEQLKSYNPIITTRLYTSDGKLLNEYSKEKRVFVPIEIIPKHLSNAFIAAEDSNFYKNSGIDPLAIVRAAVNNLVNILKGDSSTGGASTITQQVVKNFLLTNERTFQRKIKEAILASRMTKSFSKEKILELYLNQIYLGSGAYGVAAASQVYFNKSIDELSVAEVALLATLPKAPSKLDPRKNIEKSEVRRNWVINRMLDEGFITKEEADEAVKEPIVLKIKEDDSVVKADFFSDAVKKDLTELYGSDNVFEQGIVVRTSLNPGLQKIAKEALQKGIEEYDTKHGYRGAIGKIKDVSGSGWLSELQNFKNDLLYNDSWNKALVLSISKDVANVGLDNGDLGVITLDSMKWARKYISVDQLGPIVKRVSDVLKVGDVIFVKQSPGRVGRYDLKQLPEVNGAFIAMDPHTGRVLAMMGGYIDGPNQFNRSNQAKRQPGSVLKTFGYIAALENGMTPATIIMDEEITLNQGFGLPVYKPSNYSGIFYGPTTLRKGLENSINVTTIRMASQIGLDKVTGVISKFGINDSPEQIYSIVLGSAETTLMKLVTAYSIIVNGGKQVKPSMIEKIQDREGKVIYKRDRRECYDCLVKNSYESQEDVGITIPMLYDDRKQITDPATAYQITSMLEGVVQRGTAVRAKAIGKIIGGKTGTTNSSYDSWFVGFSPDLVAGVYIGFDIPRTLGSLETGASVSLPIFVDFMKQALNDNPSTPFRVPDGIKFVKIDRNTGRYPTPTTPRENVIFESFKLDDNIEGAADIISDTNSVGSEEDSVSPDTNQIY